MAEDAEAERPAAPDEPARDEPRTQDEEPTEPVDARPPVDRALARLGGTLGGRPLSVCGVLLAGAAVLLLLLAIIWLTADDGGNGDGPTCTNVEFSEAIDLIKGGDVERVQVTYAEDRANIGPILVRLSLVDDA